MKKILFINILFFNTLVFSQKVDLKIKTNLASNPTALQIYAIPQNLAGAEITNIVVTITTSSACRGFMGTPTTTIPGVAVGGNGPFPNASSDPNNTIYVMIGGWSSYTSNVDNLVMSIPLSGGSGTCSFIGIASYSYIGNDGNFYVEAGGQAVQQNIINEANNIVLPVELLSFTANKKGEASSLTWETLGEKNLAAYVIERGTDGVNFEEIGFEKPKAKTAEEKAAYEYLDERPGIGINYYRLQSKGTGKEVKYSKVVSLDFGLGLKAKAFPNPFAAELNIEIDVEQGVKGDVVVDMFDASGKQVLTKKINAEGRKLNVAVPTEGLTPGNYIVRVKNGSYTWQYKISKQ